MRYAELIQPAEPLETVKQIRLADVSDVARRDVETFVISERMASLLSDVVFPNLQIDDPGDQKGILTVATYGTGKTHLMSTIAAVAEDAELVDLLQHPSVAAAAKSVAGRFKVVRFEIGAATLPLRDIVAIELTRGLAGMGVQHTFPDWATVTNTKDALEDMMASFEKVHPDRGLLFVLDEMLEYLRGRKDAELIQDLIFLREIGEICRSTRFRFISGIQEAIFDNPRFHGVADTIRRVQARFEQVRISREDVAFVVEQRLLRKDATQRARITEHLQKFTSLYEGMSERLDRFVALFPVHPDYLRTFEQVTIVEKREILRTIEVEVARLASEEVPDDAPGLLCSDSYRARLVDDRSTRTIPEVQQVMDISDVLRNKVTSSLADGRYLDTALRIIDALSVHRLTTGDIQRPIGMTPEMLRDELCLLPPGLPERDALFLKTTVEAVIKKILTAVSGQYLSLDPENGQAYLDVTKVIDYDQQIAQRAESLDLDQLDEAYYLAMEVVLGQRDAPYVASYRIWQYDLPWALTNADRRGYLFMGAPNERSTAQPPRDFYVYFLQPFAPPVYTDEERDDEVFISVRRDADLEAALRCYAAATAKAKESTATHRPIYEDKARKAHQDVVVWLRTNMGTAMTVTYRGDTKPLAVWLAAAPGERSQVRDQIDAVAAAALADRFAAHYPGYPRFSKRTTPGTHETDVRVALTQIATRRSTQAGRSVLDGLQLLQLDGESLRSDGPYAAALLELLSAGGGKVRNRSDLLSAPDPALGRFGPWRLEPGWLMVAAAALCQLGKAEIGVGGRRINAIELDQLTRIPLDELIAFDHIAPARTLPVTVMREVAALLDLPAGSVSNAGATDALVRELLTRTEDVLRRCDLATRAVSEGTELWGDPLFDLAREREARLDALRRLLLDLRPRNSVGKMNSLNPDAATLAEARAGVEELHHVELVVEARDRLAPVAEYLRQACGAFGAGVDDAKDALILRTDMLEALHADTIDPATVVQLRTAGEAIRERFADLASRSYRHDHLDAAGDRRKAQLLEGPTMDALRRLEAVSILGAGSLAQLRADLVEIGVMTEIDEAALRRSVVLGNKPPRPIDGPSAAARLEDCERRVAGLFDQWRQTLLDALAEPEMTEQIALLDDDGRTAVERLLVDRVLPDPVTPVLVSALNQIFQKVEVRHLTAGEVFAAVFPASTPATADQLRERFEHLLQAAAAATQLADIRFLPAEETR